MSGQVEPSFFRYSGGSRVGGLGQVPEGAPRAGQPTHGLDQATLGEAPAARVRFGMGRADQFLYPRREGLDRRIAVRIASRRLPVISTAAASRDPRLPSSTRQPKPRAE